MGLLEVVRLARARLVSNEVMAQAAWTLAALLGGLALLLVMGTQVLDWRWLLCLPAAAAGAGAYRVWRRRPSAYHAAQVLDERLALADTLSSAYYFRVQAGHDPRGFMHRRLASQAEEMARTADARCAIPLRAPRAAWWAAVLAVAAVGLFAVRYGVSRRLDLRPPLASLLRPAHAADPAARQKHSPHGKKLDYAGMGLALGDDAFAPGDALADPIAGAAETIRAEAPVTQRGADPLPLEGEKLAAGEDIDGSEDGESPAPRKAGQQDTAQPNEGAPGENSSLMDKLRQAMQDLLEKMKIQPDGGGQQQAQAGKKGREAPGKQGNQRQNSKPGDPRSSSGQDADTQDGQQGQDSQSAENAQTRAAGQQAAEQASRQPGNGIGKNDGDKDLRAAEQLAAMGKIREIIGRRAADISGEATIEVRESHQQLSTPYAQRQARHAGSGAEISRDEVPLALQPYVEQYLEAARKQSRAATVRER